MTTSPSPQPTLSKSRTMASNPLDGAASPSDLEARKARSKLFQPIKIGTMALSHRIVMAPLTRFRAGRHPPPPPPHPPLHP
jgi:NADH:flavin oxidoreductase / NADH oxidase family